MCYMEQKDCHSALGAESLIWIEPILNPIDYLRKSLRHKLMKELCTDGVVASNRDVLLQNLQENASVDFDGYEIGSGLFRDLVEKQNSSPIFPISSTSPTLTVSISMTGKTTKVVQEICSLYPNMKQTTIKMELFWNKVDDVDSDELVSKICEYVKEECE